MLAVLLTGPACKSTPPTEPSGPPVATNVITITAAGTNPRNIEIAVGTRVRFINNDNRGHWMASDPHPEHNDCPEFDQLGVIPPGQQRETGNLVQARTCGYHDHDLPLVTSLQGQVVIK